MEESKDSQNSSKEIEIFMQNPSDETQFGAITISLESTVEEFFSKIQSKTNHSFNGLVLDDYKSIDKEDFNSSLSDKGLKHNMRVKTEEYSLQTFKPGEKKIETDLKTKTFNFQFFEIFSKGINLQGKCANSKCEIFQKKIVNSLGIRSYDAFDEKKPLCPVCSQSFEPTDITLINCRFQNVGRYIDHLNNDEEVLEEPEYWEIVEKHIERFPLILNGDIEWKAFEVRVENL